MNWVTLYALLKKKITEAIGLTNRFVDSLPDTGESGVLYFVDKDDPQDPDQYYMYVWDPDDSEFVLLDPDMDLSIYAKSADLATVAISGDYDDLIDKPDLSQYLTKAEGDTSYVSYDIYSDKEVTGNPALFYSVSGGRVKKAEVSFSPKQDLHGYDYPWAGGSGKNKVYSSLSGIKTRNTSGSWNGNTYTLNGSTFTVYTLEDNETVIKITTSGTPSASTSFTVGSMSYTEGVSEIMNGCPSNGSNTKYQLVSSNSSAVGYDRGRGVTITPEATVTADIKIYLYSGYEGNSLDWFPMIRLSTITDATFAPYSNICPISGWDGLSLTRTGFNQWDEEWESGAYDSAGAKKVDDTQIRNKNDILVFPNTDYYFKTLAPSARILFFDENKGFISRTSSAAGNHSFTTPVNCRYVGFQSQQTTYNNDISINYPSTDTAYHAYKGQTHTATFPSTIMGGSYDFVSGKEVIPWADKILLSSLAWQKYTTSSDYGTLYYTESLAPYINTLDVNKIYSCCDIFDSVTNKNHDGGAGTDKEQPDNTIRINASKKLYVRCESCQTLSDFESLIATHELIYIKATPTEITLTPEDVVLIVGTNVLWTDGNTVDLIAVPVAKELPAVTSSDEGKVLTVDSNGNWVAAESEATTALQQQY